MKIKTKKLKTFKSGLTMVELLISLGIAGILLAAVTPIFSSTLITSTNTRTQAEFTDEAQIALTVMTAHTRSACFVFANNSSLALPNNWKTNNGNLVVSANSFATIEPTGSGYALYAYYLIPKTTYTTNATISEKLPSDDNQVLMQYKADLNISPAPGSTCASWANSISLAMQQNGLAQVLTNHVDTFTTQTTNSSVGITIKLRDTRNIGRALSATANASGLATTEPTLK